MEILGSTGSSQHQSKPICDLFLQPGSWGALSAEFPMLGPFNHQQLLQGQAVLVSHARGPAWFLCPIIWVQTLLSIPISLFSPESSLGHTHLMFCSCLKSPPFSLMLFMGRVFPESSQVSGMGTPLSYLQVPPFPENHKKTLSLLKTTAQEAQLRVARGITGTKNC